MQDLIIYDKAKWHFEGNFPGDLAEDQAFVHTGLYLGWTIDRKLTSHQFEAESSQTIEEFRAREITGPRLFQIIDGGFASDMLSAQGNAFTAAYFDLSCGIYLEDYEDILGDGLPSLYHVVDTWENYADLKVRLNERFDEWLARQT